MENKLKVGANETPHFVGLYDNVITPEECKKVINLFNDYHNAGLTFNRQSSENAHLLNKNDDAIAIEEILKFQNNSGFDYIQNDVIKMILERLMWVTSNVYAKEFNSIMVHNVFNIRSFKIQKTEPKTGYHLWHAEKTNSYYQDRVLAWTLYLNDIEKGGETELLNYGLRIQPKAGTLCLFPAGFTHTHRGNPPYDNTKYIVTGWIIHD